MFYGSSCLVRREVFIHFRGSGHAWASALRFFFTYITYIIVYVFKKERTKKRRREE